MIGNSSIPVPIKLGSILPCRESAYPKGDLRKETAHGCKSSVRTRQHSLKDLEKPHQSVALPHDRKKKRPERQSGASYET
jgi:hypothetical protein